MGKVFWVPKELYVKLQQADKGVDVEMTVHPHDKVYGTCEVAARGKKPIKCRVRHATTKAERRDSSDTKNILVYFCK